MKIEWHIEVRKLSALREWEKNPRLLMEKGLADLKKSIEKFGLAEPLVINTDGMICGGHGRLKILLQAGIKECDCYVPNRKLTEDEFRELNIRLNANIAGEFNWELLANEWDSSALLEWGMDLPFFIGVRNDLNIEPSFPQPMKKFITLQKCIGHLENSLPDRKISEWLIKAYPELKNGIVKAFLKYKGTLGGSFSTKLLKRNKPSQTLTKSEISVSGLLHYSKPRYLTAKELLIICSFPETFKYETRELLVNRLGNAVMPKMMYHIAKNIRENSLKIHAKN